METVRADLVIIGAGYAGINALNAAARYVPKNGTIAIIDRRPKLGGMWVDQYDFVGLHQPYEQFTFGARKWSIKKHWSHLATKPEILDHFEKCTADCVNERNIKLVKLFGYEYSQYEIIQEKEADSEKEVDLVQVVATPVADAKPDVVAKKVVASKMIKATGFNVSIKKPVVLSAGDAINSLAPVDVLTNKTNDMMQNSTAPIYVLGSGKTALDVMHKLVKKFDLGDRLHCIAGRGTNFINRDLLFPTSFFRRHFLGKTFFGWLERMGNLYDGTNALETLRTLRKEGMLHSPVNDAEGFVMGIASEDEVNSVRKSLSPAEEHVIKGYLVDVTKEGNKVLLNLCSLDRKEFYTKEVPAGSFIINCTDHITEESVNYEPVISGNGLVLAPQTICGFTGPSANYATHLFYRDLLEPIWRDFPRLQVDPYQKSNLGIELGLVVLLSSETATQALPRMLGRVISPKSDSVPLHRAVAFFATFPPRHAKLFKKLQQVVKTRYTDEVKEDHKAVPILGGNIGVASKI